MRLRTHEVEGRVEPVTITVLDQSGEGGACHDYRLEYGDQVRVINFQNGPLATSGVNGITDEALLAIVVHRLESSKNKEPSELAKEALDVLQGRGGEPTPKEEPAPPFAPTPPKPSRKRASSKK